jgi:hypothetical protein
MGRDARDFKKDEMGGHARLYEVILNSPAWLALPFSTRALYVQLRVKLKNTNNGNIEATLATLKHSGFRSSATIFRALRELETVGLMAKTRQGGIAAGGRLCNLYRFTDKECWEHPKQGVPACNATKDWLAWKGVREVQAAINAAHLAAKRPKAQNESKLQKTKRVSSRSEPGVRAVDSESEQGAVVPIRDLKRRRTA